MAEDDTRGLFVWFDLMTTDPAAAQAFYKSVMGWGIQMWGESYPMLTVGDTAVGGINELPNDARAAGAPPHWMAHIATPDVDATVARAEEMGATIMHPPTDIPSVGRFAVLADPQGAVFAVFHGDDEPRPPHLPEVGEFSWFELATTDHAAAFEFYATLFGWQAADAMDMGGGAIYQLFRDSSGRWDMGGIFDMPPAAPAPNWLLYVRVADIDAACERIVAGGGQVVNGPIEVPGGDRVAQALDPQGGSFAVHWRREE